MINFCTPDAHAHTCITNVEIKGGDGSSVTSKSSESLYQQLLWL